MNTAHIFLYSIIAFGVSYMITPWAKKISQACGMVDKPNHRKMHKEPVPYGGGIAIFFGFLAALLFVNNFNYPIIGFLIGSLLLVMIGIFDDLEGLSAIPKFIFQAIAAAIAIKFGVQINMSLLAHGHLSGLESLSIPITFLWIVGITNAINLIDGLDGLAAGVSTISAFTIAAVGFIAGQNVVATLALALGAASAGFLPHNFRSKIFMGDTGSMFLGFSLATLSIMGSTKLAAAYGLFIPVLVLAIPIFDTVFAVIRRIITKKPIFEGDKKHLHHRLLDLGFSQLQTVITIYLASLFFGVLAVASSLVKLRTAYTIFGASFILVVLGGLLIVYLHQKKNGKG